MDIVPSGMPTSAMSTCSPGNDLGTYSFTATLKYGMETSGDDTLQDSEILETSNSKSGSFHYV